MKKVLLLRDLYFIPLANAIEKHQKVSNKNMNNDNSNSGEVFNIIYPQRHTHIHARMHVRITLGKYILKPLIFNL